MAQLAQPIVAAASGACSSGGDDALPFATTLPLKFFFYGSLMRGKLNHSFLTSRLRRCVFLGAAKTLDANFHLIGLSPPPYPFLMRATPPADSDAAAGASPTRIAGEVYEVDADDDAGLAHLDLLEHGYARRLVDVELNDDGSVLPAFVYLVEDVEHIADLWKGILLPSRRFFNVPGGDWRPWGR